MTPGSGRDSSYPALPPLDSDSHVAARLKPDGPVSPEAIIAALQEQNAALSALVAALKARVAELEYQIGLNGGNSGKPPSSDGLKKKPARISSLRERTGNKTGGQKGHPGKTLSRVETPDATIDHFPATCSGCGGALTGAMATGHTARQVFDLPDPQPLAVTEHARHACRCGNCGAETRAAFPEDVTAPVQYGARLAAIVVISVALSVAARETSGRVDGRSVPACTLVTATIASMARPVPRVSRVSPPPCAIMSRRRQ